MTLSEQYEYNSGEKLVLYVQERKKKVGFAFFVHLGGFEYVRGKKNSSRFAKLSGASPGMPLVLVTTCLFYVQ